MAAPQILASLPWDHQISERRWWYNETEPQEDCALQAPLLPSHPHPATSPEAKPGLLIPAPLQFFHLAKTTGRRRQKERKRRASAIDHQKTSAGDSKGDKGMWSNVESEGVKTQTLAQSSRRHLYSLKLPSISRRNAPEPRPNSPFFLHFWYRPHLGVSLLQKPGSE